MTRINVVPPAELHRKHLVAEYRELPRVFALVRAAQARGLRPALVEAPDRYTLGKGHVKFFYDKLGFLTQRQRSLIDEMRSRGYSVRFDNLNELCVGIEPCWFNDWLPDDDALRINRARIQGRLG